MEKNTQLPVEVVNAVHMEAEEIYNKLDELARDQDSCAFGLPMFNKVKEPIENALTAYATKLQQVQQQLTEERQLRAHVMKENDVITDHFDKLQKENEKLKQQATGWRPLLEEVLRRFRGISEAGGQPEDLDLINKIKKFLYGE